MVTMHGLRVHSLPCYSSAYECIAAIHLSHEALRLSPRSIIHNCQHLPYSTASASQNRRQARTVDCVGARPAHTPHTNFCTTIDALIVLPLPLPPLPHLKTATEGPARRPPRAGKNIHGFLGRTVKVLDIVFTFCLHTLWLPH